MKTNTETVQALYEAFAQGNVPFILESVDDTFTWFDPCDPAIVPHGGNHTGRAGFLNFFQQLGGNTQTTLWSVDDYVAEGDVVIATGKHGVTVPKTGKSALADWAMRWEFKNGRPVSGRSYYDTASLTRAFQ